MSERTRRPGRVSPRVAAVRLLGAAARSGRGHPHEGERQRRGVERLPRLRPLARRPGRAARPREGLRCRISRAVAGGALFGVLAGGCGDARPCASRVPPVREGREDGRDGRWRARRARAARRVHLHRGLARRLRRDALCVARVDRDRRSRSWSSSSSSTTRGRSSCSESPARRRSSCCTAQNIRRLRGRTEHRFELGR